MRQMCVWQSHWHQAAGCSACEFWDEAPAESLWDKVHLALSVCVCVCCRYGRWQSGVQQSLWWPLAAVMPPFISGRTQPLPTKQLQQSRRSRPC